LLEKTNTIGKTSLKRKAFRRKTKYTRTKYCIVPNTNDPISKENAPMDLSKSEEGSDEDPFAQLESIILGSPKFSAKSNLYYKQCCFK
jgi:hypothetical protein